MGLGWMLGGSGSSSSKQDKMIVTNNNGSVSVPNLPKYSSEKWSNALTRPITPDTDPLSLYQMASQIEQEIIKSLAIYNRCIKEMSDGAQTTSTREQEIIHHIKNISISNVEDISTSFKNLRRRIVYMELKVVEHAFITLKRLLQELSEYSFIGFVLVEIEKCLKVIRVDVEGKLKALGDTWEIYLDDLEHRMSELPQYQSKLIDLPTNASVKRLVIPRIVQIVHGLLRYIQESIAHDFFPNTISALNRLTDSFDFYDS